MQDIIQLLKEKNQHLEKFFDLNEQEMLCFNDGNFDNLEVFYQSRETLLQMIHILDERIEKSNQAEIAPVIITDKQKMEILKALDKKTELVTGILSQDLQILSCIESAKSTIIKELSQVRATKKAIGSYKSGEPTKRLDEEV